LSTHGEAAASGEASRMKKRDADSARSMLGQSAGVAERLVWSRKTRSAFSLYHGFANARSPR
jgi:hypothetical protein